MAVSGPGGSNRRRDHEVRIGEEAVEPADGWTLTWVDRERGVASLRGPDATLSAVVEGGGADWWVTVRGRRVAVQVMSWRERLLVEAERASGVHSGPVEVKATLPGLVVEVEVAEGAEVGEGDRLLTIEAMKMQNEVRAPRAGRVATIAVAAGQAVSTGQLLLRIE